MALATRMSPIEKLEDAIVARLKSAGLSSKYLIQSFPDDPDQFDFAQHEKVALVQYSGSRYGEPDATNSGAQKRIPEFAIHLSLRVVGAAVRGPYQVELIRLALQNFRAEGATFYVTKDGLVDVGGEDGTFWRYIIVVSTTPILAVPLHQGTPGPAIADFIRGE